ncbi:MAG TPA: metal-dependent hydrolase [Planococcus sp. (in: firmicutes)]|nr:metal-dependent hydrolase [Planococcus sp. (in: firmicutes)]
MTGKTHITGGIAASLAFAQLTNYDPLLMMGAGVVGSLIPDICHGGSKIGRSMPALSKGINVLFGHRSFTHSLLFLFITAFLLISMNVNEAITVGIVVGMASHCVLDMATKNGIKLLFPMNLAVRFPVTVRTGGVAEYGFLAMLSLLSVYFGYEAFSVYFE